MGLNNYEYIWVLRALCSVLQGSVRKGNTNELYPEFETLAINAQPLSLDPQLCTIDPKP